MPGLHRGLSNKPVDKPVIVVGGGPVGMVAAASLARLGVPTVLIEAEEVPKTDWRASTFHAATLELLAELGVADRMHAEGLVVPVYHFRDRRAGLVAEFDFSLLADETPYPYRLQLNQQHLVRMLHERLGNTPEVELLFGTRVTEVRQEPGGGASVTAETPDGTRVLHGAYVIGADGAGSTVRRASGVEFEGFTYPERFLIASTSVDLAEALPGIAEVNYIADPHEWLFLLRTPESWRAVWPVPADQSEEEATAEPTLQRQLQGVAPWAPGYPIIDRQLYRVHQRVAERFRVGDVLLVGDAAHINSPMGGVGLNSGIHDAIDLARRIARIADGTSAAGAEAELAAFADVRHRIAVEYVQADTQRNTQRLREADEERRRAAHAEMRATAADPERARAYMRRASLLESVRRFGVGLPPGQPAASQTPAPVH
ncbi:FAD-dependent oxidoreductase [Streptomyces radicis]|uniref:FAD-dependent monooxygenase n=1 Tax=Streptomyces radicis TaxID=1750517 RepID=A0A3A9VWR7_9ACTN|nr:NAD(P)/FAD-dependent oxidoreductase [Streptomyces radicis]RKN05189.1 FAD-dependent monooxygenase [Streptomyces radicis]RKN16722.1 FAD-dependent monooxygenase [Streptomyces radicis]